MVDVYIGVLGEPDSVLSMEFESFGKASEFCDTLTEHLKDEKKRLYVAIDPTPEYYVMDTVYESDIEPLGEIDEKVFDEICRMQEQQTIGGWFEQLKKRIFVGG